MYIHEAVARTNPRLPYIYRKAWTIKSVIRKLVFPVVETGQTLLRVVGPEGPAFTLWVPTMEDLTANDWELYCLPEIGRIRKFLKSLL